LLIQATLLTLTITLTPKVTRQNRLKYQVENAVLMTIIWTMFYLLMSMV